MRRLSIISLLFLAILTSLMARTAPAAAAPERCFSGVPGITNCISGRFLEYWEENGGLAVFGYPLSAARPEQTVEGTFLTQYFEV